MRGDGARSGILWAQATGKLEHIGATSFLLKMLNKGFARRDLMPEMCGLSNHPRKGTVERDPLLFVQLKRHLASSQHCKGEQRCEETCLCLNGCCWVRAGLNRMKRVWTGDREGDLS